MLSGPLRGAIILIGVAIALNYIDRGAVSVAAPLIKDAFALSNERYGVIVSSFYWTYVPALALAGWLADRMSVRLLMALGVATWALATIGMGFAGGVAALIGLRLLMGLGEGVAFPCGSKLIARVPEGARGLANVDVHHLWPSYPVVAGAVVAGARRYRGRQRASRRRPASGAAGPAAGRASRRRSASGAAGPAAGLPAAVGPEPAALCRHLSFVFHRRLAAVWLVKAKGFSLIDMSLLTALFYVAQLAGGSLGAWAIDRAIRAGGNGSAWRRGLLFAGVATCVAGLLLLPDVTGWPMLLAIIAATGFGYGPVPNLLFVMGQTLAGPASAGRWVGVQTALGNLSGIVGPVVTGLIVDAAGYRPAFLVTAAVVAAGTLVFAVAVPRIAPERWQAA